MAKDFEKKDIRSDKVRNIMMEKPPVLIRYGTAIIATLLVAVAFVAFYIIR
jgi:hypothetical protein